MAFVYHRVPRDMVGSVIYPLNELAGIAPDVYQFQRSKYAGREAVLEFRIPHLGLLFNDTVHCAPLHPHHLLRARRALGFDQPPHPNHGNISGQFFEIPLERILVHPVVWYRWKQLWINGAPGEDVPLVPPTEEFEPFEVSRYKELSEVTPAHVTYLRRMKEGGRRPLMFVHIPHVLVAGQIDISGVRVVDWTEPIRTD